MPRRIAALVAAVAMVALAIVVRNRADDHAVSARLTCSTELAAVCTQLAATADRAKIDVTIEPAGVTADRLTALDAGADPGIDGWLVAGPWPEMVDDARVRQAKPALFGQPGATLATSRLVTVVETERSKTVRTKCGDPPDWACVAGLFPKTWAELGANPAFGRVKADVPDPEIQAEGTAVLAAMSASVFAGRTFTVDDDALRQILRDVRSAQLLPGTEAVNTMLLSGGFAQIDVTATTEAQADAVILSAANKARVTVLYPAPVTTVNVELGTPGRGKAGAALAADVRGTVGRKAFADAGWAPPGSFPGAVVPDAGTLAALRAAWRDQR